MPVANTASPGVRPIAPYARPTYRVPSSRTSTALSAATSHLAFTATRRRCGGDDVLDGRGHGGRAGRVDDPEVAVGGGAAAGGPAQPEQAVPFDRAVDGDARRADRGQRAGRHEDRLLARDPHGH